MRHELRREAFLMINPVLWGHRCELLDGHKARAPKAKTLADTYDGDPDDDDKDIWGDAIPRMEVRDSVAVIPVKGIISQGLPTVFQKFGFVDLSDIRKECMAAISNAGVTAIAFDFDSPGGMVRGTPETAVLISQLSKPTIAYVSGQCCSAAYYLAAGVKRGIYATPSATVGSVGVYTYNLSVTKAFEALGYRVEVFKSGAYKAAGFPGTDLTDKQRSQIQSQIDSLGADFRAHVKQFRAEVEDSALQGQPFLTGEAITNKLINGTEPDFDDFIAGLGRLKP